MNVKSKFDHKKAIEVLLFIVEKCSDTYNALKVLYFADKDHLSKYGRLICGDHYVAMSNGPVPGGVYDLIKIARGDSIYCPDIPIDTAFSVEGYNIIPTRQANRDYLSASDIECLDIAIKKYGNLSFQKLKSLSHDEAYKSADQNDLIPLEAIVKILPDSDLLLDYLKKN